MEAQTFMELTVKQALYAFLSASLLEGTPLFRYGTVKATREGLEKLYGVKITRQYAGRLLREIAEEATRPPDPGEKKPFLPVYLPREKVYKLGEPGKILTARKWKRHKSRRQQASRKPEDRVNPS